MSTTAIIKKDFRDSIRSFSLLSSTVIFVVFVITLAAIQWIPVPYRNGGVETSTLVMLNSMRQPMVVMVPLISLALAYDTIAGERESGTIRLALGLPNTRADVVFGKFLGRTAVVTVSISGAYAVAGIIALVTFGTLDVVIFGLYTLLTIFYGAVYIALATGFSAATKTKQRAFVGAGALYSLFLLGWDVFLLGLQLVIYGHEIPETGLPDWFKFIGMLNPSTAFLHAARAIIPAYDAITFYPEGGALYLQNWVGFVILGFWGVVPLLLGYRRFSSAAIR